MNQTEKKKDYGVKLIPRTTKHRPTQLHTLNEDDPKIMDIAKNVIKRHEEVLKRLAKR
jgi:hypothetical protein